MLVLMSVACPEYLLFTQLRRTQIRLLMAGVLPSSVIENDSHSHQPTHLYSHLCAFRSAVNECRFREQLEAQGIVPGGSRKGHETALLFLS